MAYEEKEYTKSFEWKTWRKIFPFLKPYKATMWRILIFNLLCAGVDILLPLFQRYAIDNFIEKDSTEGLVRFALF